MPRSFKKTFVKPIFYFLQSYSYTWPHKRSHCTNIIRRKCLV